MGSSRGSQSNKNPGQLHVVGFKCKLSSVMKTTRASYGPLVRPHRVKALTGMRSKVESPNDAYITVRAKTDKMDVLVRSELNNIEGRNSISRVCLQVS